LIDPALNPFGKGGLKRARPISGLGHGPSVDKDAATERPERTKMAAEREVQSDYEAHGKGYDFFISLMKWGTISTLIVAAAVVLIIAS
jgi:hypothetical protein